MIEKITDPRAAGDWSIHRTQVGTPIGSKDTIINRGGRGRKVEEMRAAAREGKVRFIDSDPFQTAGFVNAGAAEPDMKDLIDRAKRRKKIDAKIRKKRGKVKTSAQNAFEYSFFEEIDKIANELSKTEKAVYTLPASNQVHAQTCFWINEI